MPSYTVMYNISLCTLTNVDLDMELNMLSQVENAEVAQRGMKSSSV